MSRLLVLLGALGLGCVAATDGPDSDPDEIENLSPEELKNCKGKASSSIPSSGTYVLTTFGGPDEPQPLACGGHSKSGSWYYAASRQRYGCGSHVKITANGKCVIAKTDDYGPDVCVENAAGYPIMDVSPLVSKHLFGATSVGWSQKKKVQVVEVSTSTPLGPCTSTGAGGSGGGSGGGSSGSGGTSSGGSGGSSSQCSSDGDCNPGNDGSGLICQSGACVSGCHTNAQCPGTSTCVSGQCKAPGSGGSGGTGGTGGSGGSASGGASSGGTSGGGGSGGGGQACSNHGDCNPGTNGSGLICVGNVCIPGCTANWQCPGITTCKNGQCQ